MAKLRRDDYYKQNNLSACRLRSSRAKAKSTTWHAPPSFGAYLALVRGIFFEEENIRWAQWALSVLDTRRTPSPHA
jgi:hypothetical protein